MARRGAAVGGWRHFVKGNDSAILCPIRVLHDSQVGRRCSLLRPSFSTSIMDRKPLPTMFAWRDPEQRLMIAAGLYGAFYAKRVGLVQRMAGRVTDKISRGMLQWVWRRCRNTWVRLGRLSRGSMPGPVWRESSVAEEGVGKGLPTHGL
jgi:hypothetical protein